MLQIVPSPRLASLTSLHLGGPALALAVFRSAGDVEELPRLAERMGGPIVLLGGGTNVLAADGGLPVVVARCGIEDAPSVVGGEGNVRLVRVSAGMKLPRLLAWCMKRGLCGLEGMAGVPGDVGGAIAGNAGAHGMDMGAVLHSVDVFSPDQGHRTLWREDVLCSYRSFGLKDGDGPWFALTGAVLALHTAAPEDIRRRMRGHVERKIAAQPVRAWSAGCVFKNPPSGAPSAGKLLDEAGFRGKGLGGMRFSERHANFLVNEGKGTASAALELIRSAQEAVGRRYGILLQTEVKLWVC